MFDLRPYQQQAVGFGTLNERWILADPPGTGKTVVASEWSRRHVGLTLVVCPSQVREHWAKWLEQADHFVWVAAGKNAKQRTSIYEQLASGAWEGTNGALILNYELLWRDIEQLKGIEIHYIIADEAHRLKNRNAATTKAMNVISKNAHGICLATGTPVLNRAEELWSLLHILKPKEYKSFWNWVGEHFTVRVTDFHGKLRQPVHLIEGLLPGHEAILQKELSKVLMMRKLDQLLPDLPPVVQMVIPVELSKAERKAYDEIEERYWTEFGEELVEVENEISKVTRLRQLASDWGSISPSEVSGAKVMAVVDLVEELDEQVVVLCAYKGAVQALKNELGDRAVVYTGDSTAEERESAVDMFASGDAKVFIGTIAAVGEGTDGLQVARNIVLLDRDWTPARNEQAVARVRRSGQGAEFVRVYHIVAEDTIDEKVARVLSEKQGEIERLLG